MSKKKVSSASKDGSESWKGIFNGLVNMIRDQQRQLEWFAKERKLLEKKFQSQHDRWGFEVKRLQDHILQMTKELKLKDIVRVVNAAKAELMLSMKQKEAVIHKLNFEDADDERADLKLLFDEVSKCLAQPKQRVTRSNSNDVNESALKTERDFAWNQFKKTDAKLQELVKTTKFEVEAAENKVQKLISEWEESQLSNMEKDRTISALESESRKKSEEISRLNKELELLQGDSNRSITPVLRRCMVQSNKSHSGEIVIFEKEGRGSKRKAIEIEPRLFTSKFKVPKIKS